MKKLITLLIMFCMTLGLSAENYNVWVAGKQVTDSNKEDVLGDGKVYYDSSNGNSRLVLKNGTKISYSDGYAIRANQKLEIVINGTVTIESSSVTSSPIFLMGEYNYYINRFTSSTNCKLIVKAGAAGICVEKTNASLTIAGINIDVTAGKYEAIYAQGSPKLYFEGVNATLTAATGQKPIYHFSSVSFLRCSVSSPSGAEYSTSNGYMMSGSSAVTGTLKIAVPDYGITVAGTKVTGQNTYNIGGNSNVYYIPSTNTLTLNGVTLNGGILFQCSSNPILNLKGNNKIIAEKNGVYVSNRALTIQGEEDGATLEVSQTDSQYKAINLYASSSLTIKNCEVKATGAVAAIGGHSSTPALNIDNAQVVATITESSSDTQGAVVNISALNLTGCYTQSTGPADMTYNSSLKGLQGTRNKFLAKTVTIKKGTGYDLWYKGVRVSSNYTNLSGNGKVQFNATYNRIMMVDAEVENTASTPCINSSLETLEILVSGTNKISSKGYGIVHRGNLRIYSASTKVGGSGTLELTTEGEYAINSAGNGATLTFDCVTANITGASRALNDFSGSTSLVINKSVLNLKSSDAHAVKDYQSLTMTGVDVIYPENAVWNNNAKCFGKDNNTTSCSTVKIGEKTYDISIGGTAITTSNMNDVLNNGTISFDPSTYTLTLNNALIASTGYGIYTGFDAEKILTINLIGNNRIESNKSDAVYVNMETIIKSSSNGVLKATALSGNGIFHYYKLAIENCTVEANGYNYGIIADSYSGGFTLHIKNASVKAHGTKGAFYNYRHADLVNCYVAEPHPCEFNGSAESVSGFTRYNKLCTDVQIVPGATPTWYNVQVNGKYVNSYNADDILGNGQLSWDGDKNVLTMKNLDLTYDGSAIILDEEATIKLIGDNKITATSNAITARKNSLVVDGEGSGKLTINTAGSTAPCIYGVQVPITIKDCTLDFAGYEGIIGYSQNYGMYELNLENVNATIKTDNYAMRYFTKVSLDGCKFMNGEEYSAEEKAVVLDGSIAKNVTIKAISGPYLPSDASITVVEKTNNSVSISWNAATDDVTASKNIKYSVYYGEKNSSTTSLAGTVTGKTEFTITGLTADTEYEILVEALNNDDDDAWYDPCYVTTEAYEMYGVSVGGVDIHSGNCTDVLGDGTVSYDPTVKTLTLKNANLICGSNNGVECNVTAITVVLEGKNTITSDKTPMYFDASKVVITGAENSSLELNAGVTSKGIVFSYANNVDMTDVNLNISAGSHGIYSSYSSTLAEITNCNIDIKSGINAVRGFHQFKLDNCYIENPKNAVYNVLKSCVTDKEDFSVEYSDVTIKAGVEGIENIMVDEEADNASRHNLQGVQVGKGYRGVVIKNGKKYVQK